MTGGEPLLESSGFRLAKPFDTGLAKNASAFVTG